MCVFAPRHLGESTRCLPFELVDAVLVEYAKVGGKLVAGLTVLPVPDPSEKAQRDLRRRLGPTPFTALF